MGAAQETCVDLDPLGRAIDEVDNIAHALLIPMPAEFHVRQLKAILPDLVARLKDGFAKASGHNPWLVAFLLAALLLPALAHSQSAVNATIPTPPANLIHNLYAGGVSYNSSATPAVAGTGLYARLLSDTGTYAFTAVDALPNTVRPFTVTTNMGVGVAQKVATIGTVPVFIPAATGISFSGSNTGWQWNTGALAAIRVKGNYFIMPQVRLVKSSVSNGSGYQPIIGVLFAWGN